jgi:hypothetical protein
MPLNDDTGSDFDTSIADESTYPTPATEIGFVAQRRPLAVDRGSGSYAEDGRIEVAESEIMMDGETQLGAAASMEGQTEIGEIQSPFEAFMMESPRIGSNAMYGPTEIGEESEIGEGSEIGRHHEHPFHPDVPDQAHAVLKVVETARDARQPAPPMRAVHPDEPMRREEGSGRLVRTLVGAAMASGNPDPFPLTAQFMQRCGADMMPRYVRVDTEESYKAFRTEHSPELSELAHRVEELEHALHTHMSDPEAHHHPGSDDALAEDIEDLTVLGEAAQASEDSKRVDLWMPKHFDGLVTAWREGDFVCASMTLPGSDGQIRICTSLEPVVKCVEEMSRHAAHSGVAPSTVVGVLPAMGCVLGAGTLLKEMASAAPSILLRKEAHGKEPFVVRIEPKSNPALCALAMLAMACKMGDRQACFEWENLSKVSPAPIKQAMMEALALAQASE